MKTYAEIVKKVDKDFESYTLEDKVQAINVYSTEINNGTDVNSLSSLSKEEYAEHLNNVIYNRQMYIRSITTPYINHEVKTFDIFKADIKKLEFITHAEARVLLERGVSVGYYSKSSQESSADDYVFHEITTINEYRNKDNSCRRSWYISPNCNIKEKILAESERYKVMIDYSVDNGLESDREEYGRASSLEEAKQLFSQVIVNERQNAIDRGYSIYEDSPTVFDSGIDGFYDNDHICISIYDTKNNQPIVEQMQIITPNGISVDDMIAYGYNYIEANQMLPITDDFAKELFCYDVEIYRLYSDDTEGLVESMEEIKSHIECGGMFGIESKTWDSVKDKIDDLKDTFIQGVELRKDYFEKVTLDEFEVYNKLTASNAVTEQQAIIPAPRSRGRR